MKAVGLDTSVVLRLLVGEPEKQAHTAQAYLNNCSLDGIQVFISDIVVGETYHALLYHYETTKREAVDALLKLLTSPMISTTGHAVSILSEYQGTGAGLMDRLIRMNFLEQAHEVITFDKDFSKLPNVKRLS